MRRLLARLWLYFNRQYCWPHTEVFCHTCARQQVLAERRRVEKDRQRFVTMLARARGPRVRV